MYTVYCDDMLIHSQQSTSELLHLIDPTLKLAENSAGSFTFTIAKGHPGYDEIQKLTSTIAVEREQQCLWTGRVIQVSEDFWNRRTFTCEGALAFLNDTYQPSIDYQSVNMSTLFRSIILQHNKKKKHEPDRQFTVGSITVSNAAETFDYVTDYEKTWDVINNLFLQSLGGHVAITYSANSRKPIINYWYDYPVVATAQTLNFGKNLMGFKQDWDMVDVATVIIPKGQIKVEVSDESE